MAAGNETMGRTEERDSLNCQPVAGKQPNSALTVRVLRDLVRFCVFFFGRVNAVDMESYHSKQKLGPAVRSVRSRLWR